MDTGNKVSQEWLCNLGCELPCVFQKLVLSVFQDSFLRPQALSYVTIVKTKSNSRMHRLNVVVKLNSNAKNGALFCGSVFAGKRSQDSILCSIRRKNLKFRRRKVIRMCSLLAYDYLGHPKFARGSPIP